MCGNQRARRWPFSRSRPEVPLECGFVATTGNRAQAVGGDGELFEPWQTARR
jgi:hypothetical protein